MKIRCPKCQTTYTLDDSRIPDGGTVKVQCPSCEARYRVKKKEAPAPAPAPIKKQPVSPPAAPTPPNKTDDGLSDIFGGGNDNVDDIFGSSSSSEDDLFSGNDDASPFGGASQTPPPAEAPPVSPMDSSDNGVDDLFSDIPEEESAPNDSTADLFSDLSDEDNLVPDTPPLGQTVPAPMDGLDSGRLDDGIDDIFSDIDDGPELDNPLDSSEKTMVKDANLSSGLDMGSGGIDNLFDDISDDTIAAAQNDVPLFADSQDNGEEKTMLMENAVDNSTATEDTPPPKKAHLNTAAEIGRGQQSQKKQSNDNLFTDVSFDMFDKGDDASDSLFSSTHTELPDVEKTGAATITKTPKKHQKMYATILALKIFATLLVTGLVGFGGYFYYQNYYAGKSTDVLKQMSKSIAEETGTLSDVRDYLIEDTTAGYKKATGILNQYIKNDEIPPSIIGLDALIKLNILYSYKRRIEDFKTISKRLHKALKQSPENFDLIKAKAFYNVITKKYEEAAVLLQPFVEEKDAEVMYILGVLAFEQQRYEEAHKFLVAPYISSEGANIKAGYLLSLANYKMGNAKTAIAFLNKIIKQNNGYIRAYILKANILVQKYGKRKAALALLTSIESDELSALTKADQAAYFGMLAKLYYLTGDVKKARLGYLKVSELQPQNILYLMMVAGFMNKTGDISTALQYYEKIIKIDNENVEAIVGRAEAYALLGLVSKVRNSLFRVGKDKVEDAALLTRIGNLLTNLGTDVDRVNSLEYFEKAIEIDASYIEAYLSKIFVLLDLNSLDKAEVYVDKLKKLKVDSFQSHLAQGIIYHHTGKYSESFREFKRAIKLNSMHDPRVYYRYGVLLYDSSKYQSAIQYLTKATKISPENFDYRLALGRALFAVKKYKEVIKKLKQEKYVEQKQYKILQLLSDSEYHQKHYGEALTYIDRALELYGKAVVIYYTKAKILYAMQDFNASQKAIDTALLVDMSDVNSYLLYAKIFIATGDYKSSMDKINAAERLDNGNPELFLLKGIVSKNLDDYHQALIYFKKIGKHPRLLREAYQEIAECYQILGNQKEALRYFHKAAKQGNVRALTYLASIYYDRKDMKKALAYYRRSYTKNKKDPETIKRLAYIYKEKKDFVKSLRFFQRYKKMLGDESDPVEEEMIENEIYFLKKTMPKQKFQKMVENPEAYNDDGISKATVEKAKQLYMRARSMKKTNPNKAKALFRQVMTLVPKTNRYYRKAFKQFSKIK